MTNKRTHNFDLKSAFFNPLFGSLSDLYRQYLYTSLLMRIEYEPLFNTNR